MLKYVISYFRRVITGIPKNTAASSPSSLPQQSYTRRLRKVSSCNRSASKNGSYTKRMSAAGAAPRLPAASTADRIIWMDLEMTGLDVTKDVIMEIGCIVTTANLDEVARHPEIIIHVPDALLDSMSTWCVDTHGASGLTDACRKSTVTTLEAEEKLLSFLRLHSEPGFCPLGGNSITFDRIFLIKYMPRLSAHLHYRSIDVSSIKEIVRRWYPKQYEELSCKRYVHKTVADIEDSINELKYYRSKVFISPTCSEIDRSSSEIGHKIPS